MIYLGISREIIKQAIYVEICIIVLIVLATYFIKYNSILRQQYRAKVIQDIEKYLSRLIKKNEEFFPKKFPRSWRKVQLLVPIFLKFEKLYPRAEWEDVRENLLHYIILPLARSKSRSRVWVIRFFACEVFSHAYEKADENYIIRFARDKIPLIYLHAISAALYSGSADAINAIVERISQVSRLTQSIYLQAFDKAPPKTRPLLIRFLHAASDPSIRAICYTILLKFTPEPIDWDLTNDLNSSSGELRLSALKFLSHIDKDRAIPILIEKVTDINWEVRLVALHRLGTMKVYEAMDEVANCLFDPEWWVKVSAAEALKNLGAEGNRILEEQAPDLVNVPSGILSHVSHLLW